MKMYDFGIITGIFVVILMLVSVFLHKHNKECPVGFSFIEGVAETEIDSLLHIPGGSAEKFVDLLGN